MIAIAYDQMKEAIDDSLTMSQAAVKLNLHFSTFKRKAEQYGLYKPNQGGKGSTKKYAQHNLISLNEILDGKHPAYQTFKLKNRLFKEGILENKCSNCNISEWDNLPINCELDHINGIRHDHRKENLRILCPNCHSQTDTYRAKNINKTI